MDELKRLIIENNFVFPENLITQWHAATTNKTSGIVSTRRYGKIYFYIIKPWPGCPAGLVEIERA